MESISIFIFFWTSFIWMNGRFWLIIWHPYMEQWVGWRIHRSYAFSEKGTRNIPTRGREFHDLADKTVAETALQSDSLTLNRHLTQFVHLNELLIFMLLIKYQDFSGNWTQKKLIKQAGRTLYTVNLSNGIAFHTVAANSHRLNEPL
jgi:hypothetical protein